MTIDQIREIVISPDAIMRKKWGKVLLDEIDRLTERVEKAEAELERKENEIIELLNGESI